MEYEKTIDLTAELPGVPEAVKLKSLRNLKSCTKVVVEFQTGRKRWKKVNGLKIACKPGQMPEDDADEIAIAITRCVVAHYAELGRDEDDEGANYRVFFHQLDKDGNVHRPSFEYFYSPDGGDDGVDADVAEVHSDFTPLERALERMENLFDKIALRLDESHAHIVAISNQNNAALEPLVRMSDYMGKSWLAGAQMQAQALQLVFDKHQADAEIKAKQENTREYISLLKTVGREVGKQFGKHVAKKVEGKDGEDGEEASAGWDGSTTTVDDAEPQGDEPKPSAGSQAKSETTAKAASGEALAGFLSGLGDTITPPQWGRVSALLAKKEMALFVRLFDCKTDKDAIAAYDQVKRGGIGLDKLIELRELLDDRQREALDKLEQIVEAARAGWPD